MTSEAEGICPEGKDFVDVVKYLMDPRDKEKLQRLLSDESWERFVAAAKLSRDEADALYADLCQLETLMAVEYKDMPSAEQLHGESFMIEFPQVKQDLEERIQKLYALADEVDKVHRNCTISKVAASSTGAVSGLLAITGLALAPFTAGATLVLSATGMGLGAAAAVTSVTATIVEYSKNKLAKAEASRLRSTGIDTGKVVGEALHRSTPKIASLARKCFHSLQVIVKDAGALEVDKDTGTVSTGTISVQRGKKLRIDFGGTDTAMSIGLGVIGAATSGVFLLMGLGNLMKDILSVHEGSEAEELRQEAQELERKLEELTRIHESLQEDLTP